MRYRGALAAKSELSSGPKGGNSGRTGPILPRRRQALDGVWGRGEGAQGAQERLGEASSARLICAWGALAGEEAVEQFADAR